MLVERVKSGFIAKVHKYIHQEAKGRGTDGQNTTIKPSVKFLVLSFFVITVLSVWHTVGASGHEVQFFWVKQAGGTSFDRGLDIATDGEGNVLVIGEFHRTATFDEVALTATSEGRTTGYWSGGNTFIAKYTRDGSLIWVKQVTGDSKANDIITDGVGNVYVTGSIISGAAFDDVALSSVGGMDIFIAKYAPDGTLLWVRQAGGDEYPDYGEEGSGIATDGAGNVFVTGIFFGKDAFGARIETSSEFSLDLFVAKYNPNGVLLWVKTAGTPDQFTAGYGYDVVTDSVGNVFVVGTIGNTRIYKGGGWQGNDLFFAKYDPDGTLIWAQQVDGPVTSGWYDQLKIATNGSNIYVKGSFHDMITFDGVALYAPGRWQHFIAKFTPDGTPQWAKGVDILNVFISDIAVDRTGNVFAVGDFSGTAEFDGSSVTSAGFTDIFVAKYDPSGNFLATKTAGGPNHDRGWGIAADSTGDVAITGSFIGSATFDGTDLSAPDNTDIFITKIGIPSAPDRNAGNESLDRAASISEEWEHPYHWLCSERIRRERRDPEEECPDVFEHGLLQPGYGAKEIWTLVIPDLSITGTTERDFFRVSIPDPGNPDDGGHSDIRPSTPPRDPDPEPLPECGIVHREGYDLQGNPIPIDIGITGKLVVTVIPTNNSVSARPVSEEGETIQLYRDRDGDGTIERDDELGSPEGGSLQKTIICPRSRKDLSELVFSFGERADPRPNLSSTGGYALRLEYKIEISREFPPPAFAEQLEQFVGGISCLYLADPFIDPVSLPRDDFPYCPSILDFGFPNFRTPFRLELGHPMEASRRCDGDGCPEFFVIQWPSTDSRFDVTFASRTDLSFTLYDTMKKQIGEAVPFDENRGLRTGSEITLNLLSVHTLKTTLQSNQIKKRLFIPQLGEGVYMLEVGGPKTLYTLDFIPSAGASSDKNLFLPYLWILLVLILIVIMVFWLVLTRRKKRQNRAKLTQKPG